MQTIPEELAHRNLPVRSDELLEVFEIDPAPIWPADDARLEPIFLAGPPGNELEDFRQHDGERSDEAVNQPLPAPRRRGSAISVFGSFGVHLLLLLGLVGASSAPAELSGAIPVQLVIEEPQSATSAVDEAQPAQSVAESTGETARAVAAPAAATPPERRPPPVASAIPPPKPSPPKPPEPNPAVAAAPATTPAPNSASRAAAAPGPNASRGDYLDYLVTLTRGHFDLLPLSFLAGRRGRTILSVMVFEDGTISRVAVKHSSGYPDIDARIERMVAAVGRFPPVPDSFRKPSVELDFNLAFPDALQQ